MIPGAEVPTFVRIAAADVTLDADLAVPPGARGAVVFAHGSGSSRRSPRNRYVAEVLRSRGLATLLVDLLTPAEERGDDGPRRLRFDVGLLSDRLVAAVDWLRREPTTAGLRIGCYGASTGGAAALMAAAARPRAVGAVVSRGGRPDLAGSALPLVAAPTLLLVGADDLPVIGINERARAAMRAPTQMTLIPDASHLFEEPGALERVAELSADWFV